MGKKEFLKLCCTGSDRNFDKFRRGERLREAKSRKRQTYTSLWCDPSEGDRPKALSSLSNMWVQSLIGIMSPFEGGLKP